MREQAQAEARFEAIGAENSFRISFPSYEQISSRSLVVVGAALATLSPAERAVMDARLLPFNSFEISTKLGGGGFCSVYRGALERRHGGDDRDNGGDGCSEDGGYGSDAAGSQSSNSSRAGDASSTSSSSFSSTASHTPRRRQVAVKCISARPSTQKHHTTTPQQCVLCSCVARNNLGRKCIVFYTKARW